MQCRRGGTQRARPVKLHLVHIGLEAVENNELAALELIIDELAHIAVVAQEGAGIGEHELLIDDPALGHRGIECVEQPHAVILDNDAVGLCLLRPLGEVLGRELLLTFKHTDDDGIRRELLGRVLLLALLADEQQGLFLMAEALVLKRLLYERGLAALQETRGEIYRHLFRLRIQLQTAPSAPAR